MWLSRVPGLWAAPRAESSIILSPSPVALLICNDDRRVPECVLISCHWTFGAASAQLTSESSTSTLTFTVVPGGPPSQSVRLFPDLMYPPPANRGSPGLCCLSADSTRSDVNKYHMGQLLFNGPDSHPRRST